MKAFFVSDAHRTIFLLPGVDRRSGRWFRRKLGGGVWIERGTAWRTGRARVHMLCWVDLIEAEAGQPFARRIWRTLCALGAAATQGVFADVRRADRYVWRAMLWSALPFLLTALVLLAFLLWPIAGLLLWGVVAFLWAGADRLGIEHVHAITRWSRHLAKGDHAGLEARIGHFTDQIAAAPDGEIVVIGHSLGAALALRAVAAARARGVTRPITLITLGHSIPLVSAQTEAEAMRRALHRPDPDLLWFDISALHDPIGFLTYDPSLGRMRALRTEFSARVSAQALKASRLRPIWRHYLYFEPATRPDIWDWDRLLKGSAPVADTLAGFAKRIANGPRGARYSTMRKT